MRRQEIRLLAQARQGDVRARCEVGRRYLLGVDGFARHPASGIEHLRQAALSDPAAAATILAECLPLHELLEAGQHEALARAATNGSPTAQARFGAWLCTRDYASGEGRRWLSLASAAGHAGALAALNALAVSPPEGAVLAVLRTLDASGDLDGRALARIGTAQAREAGDLQQLTRCLSAALALAGSLTAELADDVVAAVRLAQVARLPLRGLDLEAVRESLEQRAAHGDQDAAFIVGRALCGIAVDGLPAALFAEHQNMRKGTAFLLRAADAGCDEAWLHLYRLHADHRLSVANPPMARFFLEKAALCGQAEAQRKLGALLLRSAATIAESEQAIHWLHAAAAQGDGHAAALQRSLVLPLAGSDAEAAWAASQARAADPWLAARLALSRAFGLTKLEALSVDPVEGLRPWGLVVGRNPFIVQARLSAPRAIPALSAEAMQTAERVSALFQQLRGDGAGAEGDLRNRSLRQRRLFERLGLDEALFFADVSSMTLEALRLGAKWAHRARLPLNEALAA